MALLAEFKADTKKDLMNQVEAVIDKRVTKLFSQVAERMDKMDARTTRIESSVEVLTAPNEGLTAEVSNIAQKLDALAYARSASHTGRAGFDSRRPGPSASTSGSSHTTTAPDSADLTLLFFWPVAASKAHATQVVAQVWAESVSEAARNDVLVTGPTVDTTCGLQFSLRRLAPWVLDAIRSTPMTLDFPDGTSAELRADFAKPEGHRARGRAFQPVHKAILELGFSKSKIIQRHSDNHKAPTTSVHLDYNRVAKGVGACTFLLAGAEAKIVGDACVASDMLRERVTKAARITNSG